MDQQIYSHNDLDPSEPETIVADNVLEIYVDDIVNLLNSIYGGEGTALHFENRDQP